MLKQIYLDYSSLPPLHEIQLHEIRFFYDGLRHDLLKAGGHGR